jgi:cardiolipin synthase A/B
MAVIGQPFIKRALRHQPLSHMASLKQRTLHGNPTKHKKPPGKWRTTTPQFSHTLLAIASILKRLSAHSPREGSVTVGDVEYFTEAAAASLVGRRYRSTARYSRVAPGPIGRVTGRYVAGSAGRCFGVDVTWEGVRGGSPLDLERGGLTDGFSRAQLFTVFTGGPNTGRRAMVPLDGPDGGPGYTHRWAHRGRQPGGRERTAARRMSRRKSSRYPCRIAVTVVAVILAECTVQSPAGGGVGPGGGAMAMASGRYRLVTEPGDGLAPIYTLISSATTTLDMSMYELVDVHAEELLAADAARKVAVRVVLDHRNEGAANQAAFSYLSAHGVQVHWAPPGFEADHAKSLVVNGDVAGVLTLNLTSRYYPTTRGFAVIDTDGADVAAIEKVFDADFAGNAITAPGGNDLMWSPGSESQMVAFIASAHLSVALENEEMSDPAVIAALVADAKRHVTVTITMTTAPQWAAAFTTLTSAGVQVHVDTGEKPIYVHAKAVVDDAGTPAAKVDIGSENDTRASLDANRELGLTVTDPAVVASVAATLAGDFAAAAPWQQ